MVDESFISVIVIITVLLSLLLFIWRCKINLFREVELLKRNSKRRLSMSVSTEKLPFKLEENSIKRDKENGIVSMIVAGDFNFTLQICCCVNFNDFKRGLNSNIKRKPIDLLHLISQWVSVPAEVPDGLYQFKDDDISDIAVKKTLKEILTKEVTHLVPYAVHFALNCKDENNQIISLTTFITLGSLKNTLEVQEQFIEIVDGRVLSLKKLYNSGIPDDRLSPQEPIEACIICHFNPVTRALVPCRHSCVCKVCLYNIQMCPVCRMKIESSLQIKDETEVPISSEEQQGQISTSISNMGFWNFVKAVWNAS